VPAASTNSTLMGSASRVVRRRSQGGLSPARFGAIVGGMSESKETKSLFGAHGNEVAMVFDGNTGNAIDAFDYTADELERRALDLRKDAGEVTTVTMDESPFGRLS